MNNFQIQELTYKLKTIFEKIQSKKVQSKKIEPKEIEIEVLKSDISDNKFFLHIIIVEQGEENLFISPLEKIHYCWKANFDEMIITFHGVTGTVSLSNRESGEQYHC